MNFICRIDPSVTPKSVTPPLFRNDPSDLRPPPLFRGGTGAPSKYWINGPALPLKRGSTRTGRGWYPEEKQGQVVVRNPLSLKI